MSGEKFFPKAYQLGPDDDVHAFYSQWAKTYDAELAEMGYESPRRCAEALAKFTKLDAPIMDIGCGTGLSGQALADVGFTNITGSEVNEEMLAYARSRSAYKSVAHVSIEDPLPFERGTYDIITAIGVISSGAAPASLLHDCLAKLSSGGLICFSFNDHALQDPPFPKAVADALANETAKQLFCEHGPHLISEKVGSNVYVLERL